MAASDGLGTLVPTEIMISITPINGSDGEQPYREFFQKEFITRRLGKPGNWQGGAVDRLDLKNPVNLETFRNLLHGRSPDGANSFVPEQGAPNRPLGWRLTVSTSPSLTLLWALAPPEQRLHIERAHLRATRHALQYFERTMGGARDVWRYSPQLDPVGLFARFSCGAAGDQTPHLRTTAFFFNFVLNREGTARTFTTDEVRRHQLELQAPYEEMLRYQLIGVIGPYMETQCMDLRIRGVPQELATKFRFDPSFKPWWTQVEKPMTLRSDELFAAWQSQAEEWGWGAKQARQLLIQARCVVMTKFYARQCMRKLLDTARQVEHARKVNRRFLSMKLSACKRKLARQSRDQDISHSH